MPAIIEPKRTGRGHSAVGPAAYEINWNKPNDQELAAFVQFNAREHDARHLWWIERSKVQLAWAAGEQLKVWDAGSRSLVDSYDVLSDRIALFVNRLKPAILNWISMITARPISFRVNAATDEDDDIASASVSDKLAQYYWKKLLADVVFVESLWMMFCTGCVIYRSTWDPFEGDEFRVKPKDLVDPDERAGKNGTGITMLGRFRDLLGGLTGVKGDDVPLGEDDSYGVSSGDLVCEMLTGFDLIVPVRAHSIKKSEWIIVRQYVHMEEMLARYGAKKIEPLSPNHSEPFYGFQDYGLNDSWQYSSGGIRGSQRSPDHILVYEIWRPRRKWLKNGFMGIVAQGHVLHKGKNPYDHGQIPLVMIQELPSPKSFWPPSTVQDLMSLQTEVNVTKSQVAEHKAMTVQPRIIAERGIGLDDMAFTRRGEIVEVRGGAIDKVRPWVPEPLPAYLPYWEQSLRADFEDVSRNHSASYGKQKSSIKSGKQAMALQDADARINTPMMRLLRSGYSDLCKQWLSTLHQFVDEERVTTIIGENGQPEVLKWSKATMASELHNVECELGPALDRGTTMELIDMLSARGWINPQSSEDRFTVYRWLGQGVAHQIDDSTNDRRNASLENERMMLTAKMVSIIEGDDDTTHLLEHARKMKTAQYRRLISQNPDVDKIFRVHMIAHERQRIFKQVRQKIFAQEIELEMLQKSPVGRMMAAQAEAEQKAEASKGQSKSSSPSKPAANRPGTSVPKANANKKQRPIRASRKVPAAPAGYEKRGNLLLPIK